MRSERGNILFLILLAVVLFAALSYAVTSSLRGGGTDASSEKAEAVAATIMQIQVNTSVGLQRFMLMKGYTLDKVDMTKSGETFGGFGDMDACTTDACNLHHPDGGNVPAPTLPSSAWMGSTPCCAAYLISPSNRLKPQYLLISVKDVGTSLPEVVAYYSLLRPDVCQAINVASGALAKGEANTLTFALGTLNTAYAYLNTAGLGLSLTPNQLGSADNRLAGRTAFGSITGSGSDQRCSLVLVLQER